MDLMKTPLLAGLMNRLEFLSARTGVIAENIANADTPDYAARDLAAPSFSAVAGEAMRVSSPRHIAIADANPSQGRARAAPDGEASLNGNKVSLETQMMKLSETRMDFQLASSVYRKSLAMIRLAVRGGN